MEDAIVELLLKARRVYHSYSLDRVFNVWLWLVLLLIVCTIKTMFWILAGFCAIMAVYSVVRTRNKLSESKTPTE